MKMPGRSLMPVVVAVAVIAIAGGLVLAVYLQQSGKSDPAPIDTAADQDKELVALQKQFKGLLEGAYDIQLMLHDVTEFLARYPENTDGHILHAQVLLKMEQWSLAYPALNLAVRERGDDFELLKLTGMCAGKLGKWEEAQAHLEAANELRKDLTVMLALGNVYYQTGQYEAGIEAYLRAKDNSGTTSPHKALSGLADVHDAMGNHAKADEYLRQADVFVQADPDTAKWTYRLQRVRITMDREEWDDARQMLIQIAGDHTAAIYTLGYARLRARWCDYEGHPEKAVGCFSLVNEKILLRNRDEDAVAVGYHADVLAGLAYWQIEAGQNAEAAGTIRDLRKLNATHPQLPSLEAALAEQSNR